ncbi:MAG: hypothetical protein Q8P84_05535, partial [Deltaproteobacteria bacterium]|nr:hypothetical protein [Deltaproteobacteria bacterium]
KLDLNFCQTQIGFVFCMMHVTSFLKRHLSGPRLPANNPVKQDFLAYSHIHSMRFIPHRGSYLLKADALSTELRALILNYTSLLQPF